MIFSHIFEDRIYCFIVLLLRLIMYFSFNVKGPIPKIFCRDLSLAYDSEICLSIYARFPFHKLIRDKF